MANRQPEGVIGRLVEGSGVSETRVSASLPVEQVKHPEHYHQDPGYEPWVVIRKWNLGFALGNAVKYIARAGRKGSAVVDLRKAIEYITNEIEALEPPPPAFDPVTDHDSLDGHRMMHTALRNAHMRTEPGLELAMKDEVRVLREIAEQGWVVIRAEHV